MKFIRNILTGFLSKNNQFSFEDKVTLLTTYYLCIMGFLCVLGNIYLKLGPDTVLLLVISTVLLSFCFVIGRAYGKITFCKWGVTIYFFIFCNVYWLVNYGSRGSAMYPFIMYFCIVSVIWDRSNAMYIALLILLDLFFLFMVELMRPGILGTYPSEWSRITDSYVTLLMVNGLTSIIIISAKNNYIQQFRNAQQSDKLKSAFLANMSHEIRTPLNAILGFTQLIAKRELPNEKKEQYAKLINDNGRFLMKLVSDILDVSLIESGQLKISKYKFNLNDLFDRLYFNHERILRDAGKKGVTFIKDLPDEHLFIESDEVRIEQIMSNMISNAIKFTFEGHIKFGLLAKRDHIVFYVEDTGCGIKDEFKDQIFNRFVKYEDDIDKKFAQGAGIGLTLSKELVQLLNGRIWFTSTYLKGTTFYFSLPVKHIVQEDKNAIFLN